MTHTIESLMALADTYCERHYELLSNTGDARAALQSALTEVLAELQREQADNVAMSMLADEYKAELAEAQGLAGGYANENLRLQSNCEGQAAEIELLRTCVSEWVAANGPLGWISDLRAKVAAMESALQAPCSDWKHRDMCKAVLAPGAAPKVSQAPIGEMRENGVVWFGKNPHAFPVGTRYFVSPGAAPDMTRDHYWSKVDARCKELEAKVESQAREIERLTCIGDAAIDAINAVKTQRDTALTRVAEMESQEPDAWRTFDGEGQYYYRSYEDNENYKDEWERKYPNRKGWVEPLYLAPGAAPKEWTEERKQAAAKSLVDALAEHNAQAAPAAWEPDMPKIGCVQHDCDECKARTTQEAKIVVGKYTLSQGRMKGRVWIEHESGEGGDFEVERWYKENF